MLHLRLDGNEAEFNSVKVGNDFTITVSKKVCFGVFIDFYAVKVKETKIDICRAIQLKYMPTKRGALCQQCDSKS